MAIQRSRNYPSLSLGAAIDKARQLYKQEGRARAPASVVVKAWGYNSLNGASLRTLSALRQYGLLDGSNHDTRLSDRALALLLEPEDSPQYSQALMEALSAPALFQEIMQEYGADVPSDAALRSYLVRKQNFNEGAASSLIQSFRESVDLVSARKTMYSEASTVDNAASVPVRAEQRKDMSQLGIATQTQDRRLEFASGNIAAMLTIRGGAAAAADVEVVSEWLKLAEKALRMTPTSTSGSANEHSTSVGDLADRSGLQ